MPTLKDYVASKASAWADLLGQLVRIPSLYENEHILVNHLEAHITTLGVPVRRVSMDCQRMQQRPAAQQPISIVRGRDCLLAVVAGSGGGRSLALSAHMDTVETGLAKAWTHPPHSGYVDDQNRLFGRGAMDDKAGVAIALAVMEALTERVIRPKGDVVFHFALDEEVTGNGTLALLDEGLRPDAAIIIDGTRPDRAIDRFAGQFSFSLALTGRPASVSVAHLGLNAAELLAELIAELKAEITALNSDRQPPWTLFPFPFSLSTTAFHADGGIFTIPELAEARCFVTFPPPWTLARMQALLTAVAERHAAGRDLDQPATLSWNGLAVEPVQSLAEELATALQAAGVEAGLPPIAVTPSTGGSDMRHFVARAIPCLLYGPGRGFNPHRPDEHYYLDDLAPMTHLFLSLVARWCGERP
jgi:acetylornithine deacetylase